MTVEPGPFDGLVVVEIGQFVVVPVCSMQLAHGGARVIKIEPPEGDTYRSSHPVVELESRHYLAKNRGKQSVALRLGAPGVDEILRRLFVRADVVLSNMSPAALRRHGLTYEAVRRVNERVIFANVSGYGHVGPEADRPGLDVIAQARSGLLTAFGAEHDDLPLHSEVQAADYTASTLLLAGIASALYARERTGQGQKVEVSLLGGALALQGNALQHLERYDGWRTQFLQDLPRMRAEGRTPREIEDRRDELRPDGGIDRSAYRVVRTSDGCIALAAGGASGRGRVLAALGIELDASASSSERADAIDGVLATNTTAHWSDHLSARGIPVSDVRHVEEMLFDEHVLAEGLIVEVEHERVGVYRTLGAPVRLSATPFTANAPSPPFARHTRLVLEELGFAEAEVEAFVGAGAVAVAPA